MVPIALASVVGLAAFIERSFALRRARVLPHGFAVEVVDLIRQARFSDAATLCRKDGSAAARIVTVVLSARGSSREEIKARVEEVGRREAAELERNSEVIGTVASVSPLLGLLGTVWGMILTFEVIEAQGVGVISSLAGGISQALITTMAGLSVAIPAVIAHRWVLGRVDDLLLDLEALTIGVLDDLVAGDAAG